MRRYLGLVGLLFVMAGMAVAQGGDYPKFDTSPAFMYIRMSPNFSNAFSVTNPVNGQILTGHNTFNCVGGGGTFTYNATRALGIGADLGACKFVGDTIGLGNSITGYQFTYLFGPRLILRNASPFTPFFDVQFGADKLSASCKNSATLCSTRFGTGTYSKNAFALTAGGGMDIRMNKKFSIRLIQAEYLYTRFGNACALPICSNNNNQNSFRLKSGIVVAWGTK